LHFGRSDIAMHNIAYGKGTEEHTCGGSAISTSNQPTGPVGERKRACLGETFLTRSPRPEREFGRGCMSGGRAIPSRGAEFACKKRDINCTFHPGGGVRYVWEWNREKYCIGQDRISESPGLAVLHSQGRWARARVARDPHGTAESPIPAGDDSPHRNKMSIGKWR